MTNGVHGTNSFFNHMLVVLSPRVSEIQTISVFRGLKNIFILPSSMNALSRKERDGATLKESADKKTVEAWTMPEDAKFWRSGTGRGPPRRLRGRTDGVGGASEEARRI